MDVLIGLMIIGWFVNLVCAFFGEVIDLCKDIKHEVKLYKNRKRLEKLYDNSPHTF